MAAGSNSTVSADYNIVRGTQSQLILFLVFNIWPSHIGLPLLLTIIYFGKVKRYATFINLCVTFMIAGFATSILVYSGQATGPEPSKLLCLVQASLLYGYPPMTSAAACALVIQMFLALRASLYKKDQTVGAARLWALLVTPYFAFLATALATACVGARQPGSVSRSRRFFYCSVKSEVLTGALMIFTAFFLLTTLFFQGWLVLILVKRWRALKSKVASFAGTVDLSGPIRILVFGLYSTLALCISLLSLKAPESPAPDLIMSTAATVFLLLFGSQKDIIKAACFWRPRAIEHPGKLGTEGKARLVID